MSALLRAVGTIAIFALVAVSALRADRKLGAGKKFTVTQIGSVNLSHPSGRNHLAVGGGDMYYTMLHHRHLVAVNLTSMEVVCEVKVPKKDYIQDLCVTASGKYFVTKSAADSGSRMILYNSSCHMLQRTPQHQMLVFQLLEEDRLIYLPDPTLSLVELRIPSWEEVQPTGQYWMQYGNAPAFAVALPAIRNNYPENRNHVILSDRSNSSIQVVDFMTGGTVAVLPQCYPTHSHEYKGFDDRYHYYLFPNGPNDSNLTVFEKNRTQPESSHLVLKNSLNINIYNNGLALAPKSSEDGAAITTLLANNPQFGDFGAKLQVWNASNNALLRSVNLAAIDRFVVWKDTVATWGEHNFTISTYPGAETLVNVSVGRAVACGPPELLGTSGLAYCHSDRDFLEVRDLTTGDVVAEFPYPKKGQFGLPTVVYPERQQLVVTVYDQIFIYQWEKESSG